MCTFHVRPTTFVILVDTIELLFIVSRRTHLLDDELPAGAKQTVLHHCFGCSGRYWIGPHLPQLYNAVTRQLTEPEHSAGSLGSIDSCPSKFYLHASHSTLAHVAEFVMRSSVIASFDSDILVDSIIDTPG